MRDPDEFEWKRPQRIDQIELFSQGRDHVISLARVSIEELEAWRAEGWISFDARDQPGLDEGEVAEIVFIRNVVRSGLSHPQIRTFLSHLEPPYRYDPRRLAWCFNYGWVERPPVPNWDEQDEYFMHYFFDWVKQLASEGHRDVLGRLMRLLMDGARAGEEERNG